MRERRLQGQVWSDCVKLLWLAHMSDQRRARPRWIPLRFLQPEIREKVTVALELMRKESWLANRRNEVARQEQQKAATEEVEEPRNSNFHEMASSRKRRRVESDGHSDAEERWSCKRLNHKPEGIRASQRLASRYKV